MFFSGEHDADATSEVSLKQPRVMRRRPINEVTELGAGRGTHVEVCEMLTTMPIKGIHVSQRFRESLEVTLERWLTTAIKQICRPDSHRFLGAFFFAQQQFPPKLHECRLQNAEGMALTQLTSLGHVLSDNFHVTCPACDTMT